MKTFISYFQLRDLVFFFILFSCLTCTVSIEIVSGSVIITSSSLDNCEGVELFLTIDQPGKTVSIKGKIKNGRIVFDSTELGDLDFNKRMTLKLQTEKYNSKDHPDCEKFPPFSLYLASNKKLKKVGRSKYEIDGDEFVRSK